MKVTYGALKTALGQPFIARTSPTQLYTPFAMATNSMQVESPTHIDVLIVGAGLGGLYAAIECHRQGHAVTVVESKPRLEGLGV